MGPEIPAPFSPYHWLPRSLTPILSVPFLGPEHHGKWVIRERSNTDPPIPTPISHPRNQPPGDLPKGLCSSARPTSHSSPVDHPPGCANNTTPRVEASGLLLVMWAVKGRKGPGEWASMGDVGHVQSQGLLLSLLKRPKLFTSVLNHLLQIEVKAPTCKENTCLCCVDSVGGVTKTLAGQLSVVFVGAEGWSLPRG